MRTLAKYLLFFILLCVAGCATRDIFPRQPEFNDSDLGMDGAEMVLIPAGDFLMGSPEGEGYSSEHPQHTVFLDAFYIDKYEVTNAQYKQFTDATGHRRPERMRVTTQEGTKSMDAALNYWDDPKYSDYPVVGVSWYDAWDYCEWAGKRLPTEAEWEKAARGGLEGKRDPWGDSITYDDANYDGIGGKDQWDSTAPVGSFTPNGYGLYDMAGNVLEWCADWRDAGSYSGYYEKSPEQNPKGPSNGSSRVLRGGSWRSGSLRAAERGNTNPAYRYDNIGFRCARDGEVKYIGSKIGEVKYAASNFENTFHRLTCPWANRIHEKHKVFYYTREEAIADGKRPCEACIP